jgi:hypothetical protein
MIGKELKNILGQYKEEMLALPVAVKDRINAATKESAVGHLTAFGSAGKAEVIREHLKQRTQAPVSIASRNKPSPATEASLAAAASPISAQERLAMASELEKLPGVSVKFFDARTGHWSGLRSTDDVIRQHVGNLAYFAPELVMERRGVRTTFFDILREAFPQAQQVEAGTYADGRVAITQAMGFGDFTAEEQYHAAHLAVEEFRGPRSQALMSVRIITDQNADRGGDIFVVSKKSSSAVAELEAPDKVGGINLNPALINLQIKRDGRGVPLPVYQQPIGDIKISGFVPVIIEVKPVDLSRFLDLQDNSLARLPRPR